MGEKGGRKPSLLLLPTCHRLIPSFPFVELRDESWVVTA